MKAKTIVANRICVLWKIFRYFLKRKFNTEVPTNTLNKDETNSYINKKWYKNITYAAKMVIYYKVDDQLFYLSWIDDQNCHLLKSRRQYVTYNLKWITRMDTLS